MDDLDRNTDHPHPHTNSTGNRLDEYGDIQYYSPEPPPGIRRDWTRLVFVAYPSNPSKITQYRRISAIPAECCPMVRRNLEDGRTEAM